MLRHWERKSYVADWLVTDKGQHHLPTSPFTQQFTSINVFEEDGICSPNIIAEPIRTGIHACLTREERDLYIPNNFFYADSCFVIALPTEVRQAI
jgi:hypothetical protein